MHLPGQLIGQPESVWGIDRGWIYRLPPMVECSLGRLYGLPCRTRKLKDSHRQSAPSVLRERQRLDQQKPQGLPRHFCITNIPANAKCPSPIREV